MLIVPFLLFLTVIFFFIDSVISSDFICSTVSESSFISVFCFLISDGIASSDNSLINCLYNVSASFNSICNFSIS
jgi:hypothetical protein